MKSEGALITCKRFHVYPDWDLSVIFHDGTGSPQEVNNVLAIPVSY